MKMYDPDRHIFVGFAINCMKNSIFALIKRTKKRSPCEGLDSLTFTGEIESIEESNIDDDISLKFYKKTILDAAYSLDPLEKELFIFIFLKHNTIIKYALYIKIASSTTVNRRSRLTRKLNSYTNKLS